ncbi:unnamed protein product [Amoebophrya sp. A25]|nr:unnamed protein product [Amoebophrya sp. A25]|eukprot:GSA25T00018645001.1
MQRENNASSRNRRPQSRGEQSSGEGGDATATGSTKRAAAGDAVGASQYLGVTSDDVAVVRREVENKEAELAQIQQKEDDLEKEIQSLAARLEAKKSVYRDKIGKLDEEMKSIRLRMNRVETANQIVEKEKVDVATGMRALFTTLDSSVGVNKMTTTTPGDQMRRSFTELAGGSPSSLAGNLRSNDNYNRPPAESRVGRGTAGDRAGGTPSPSQRQFKQRGPASSRRMADGGPSVAAMARNSGIGSQRPGSQPRSPPKPTSPPRSPGYGASTRVNGGSPNSVPRVISSTSGGGVGSSSVIHLSKTGKNVQAMDALFRETRKRHDAAQAASQSPGKNVVYYSGNTDEGEVYGSGGPVVVRPTKAGALRRSGSPGSQLASGDPRSAGKKSMKPNSLTPFK